MPVDLYKRGPAITDIEIDTFEARIRHALPSDYRTFLLTCNGGRPNFHVIRNATTGDLGVQSFFGICDNESFDIDSEFRRMRGRWPSRFLSIGIDDCGNHFCLSLGAPDFGNIYWWFHEAEADEDEEPTELNLHLVAGSFSEFWDRMEPIDRDEYLAEKGFDFDAGEENGS